MAASLSSSSFRRRALRAAWLTVSSGGSALWRQLCVTYRVARDADIDSDADILLVPGYRLNSGEVGRRFSNRLERAWKLCRRQPRQLILSGYASADDLPSEAHAALDYLMDLGMPPDLPVRLDITATNSRENLLGAQSEIAFARSNGRSTRVAVVSNRYHLARLGELARRLDMEVDLVAAEERWRITLRGLVALLLESAAIMTLDSVEPEPDSNPGPGTDHGTEHASRPQAKTTSV